MEALLHAQFRSPQGSIHLYERSEWILSKYTKPGKSQRSVILLNQLFLSSLRQLVTLLRCCHIPNLYWMYLRWAYYEKKTYPPNNACLFWRKSWDFTTKYIKDVFKLNKGSEETDSVIDLTLLGRPQSVTHRELSEEDCSSCIKRIWHFWHMSFKAYSILTRWVKLEGWAFRHITILPL